MTSPRVASARVHSESTHVHVESDGPSVGELVGSVATDLSTLMRQELELAKAELSDEAKKAGKGAGMLGGAGYAAHMVSLLLTVALVLALGSFLPDAVAALIVAALWAVIAAVLFVRGRAALKSVNPKPEQTIESLKEDKQWASPRTR